MNCQNDSEDLLVVELYGLSFLQNSNSGCFIDSIKVSCEELKEARDAYYRSLNKCNPCWLKLYSYDSREILTEGKANQVEPKSFHFIFEGEIKVYDEDGEYKKVVIEPKEILKKTDRPKFD